MENNENQIILINKKIIDLENDLKKLVEMFKLMDSVVNEQTIIINSIQDNIIDINLNTNQGLNNLEKVKYGFEYTRTIFATFGTLILGFIFFV